MKAAETYSTGKVCKNGHKAERYVATGKCTMCMAASRKRHYARYPEKCNEQRKKWRIANPRAHKERVKIWKEANKAHVLDLHRKRKGLPEATRSCPDVCEKCQRPSHDGRALALDHCKETGIFRGWLCFTCNTGIGKLGDNIGGVEAALDYLKRAYAA